MIKSYPANAETKISNVDFGKWKLVSKLSTTLNSKPSFMNNDVDDHLSQAPGTLYDDSKALREVVPTDIIFPLFFSLHLSY